LRQTDLKSYLASRRRLVEAALKKDLHSIKGAAALQRAMAYSVFAGGKRLRPVLAIAAAEVLGRKPFVVMPTACGLELIHTYSLIHDDLPCMDDDDMRRGRATSHKVYGEAMATLTGDALLTLAFQLIADNAKIRGVSPARTLSTLKAIALAAGAAGMVGGQAVDTLSQDRKVSRRTLDFIHTRKTGALIAASVSAGATIAGGRPGEVRILGRYGEKIGLAFQIIDDVLDVQGDEKKMGKRVGSDIKKKKITYPGIVGVDASLERAKELVKGAKRDLVRFGRKAEVLSQLADFIIERTF